MTYNPDLLKRELSIDLGCRNRAESVDGWWTIGIGHRLSSDEITAYVQDNIGWRRLSAPEIDAIYRADLMRAEKFLFNMIPYWKELDDARQRAFLNIAFTSRDLTFTYHKKLQDFGKFLDAVDEQKWEEVVQLLKETNWYQSLAQPRADRIIHMLLTGENYEIH